MKFEDFLMQKSEVHQKRLELEEEVAELQGELEEEQGLNGVLQCALHGPPVSRTCLSSLLPLQVQVLLAELEMVEEEIAFLERKVEELNFCLYHEKRQTKHWQWQCHGPHEQHGHFKCRRSGSQKEVEHAEELSQIPKVSFKSQRRSSKRNSSLTSISEKKSTSQRGNNDGKNETSSCCTEYERSPSCPSEETKLKKPNKISEELITCLIEIFYKLHLSSNRADSESSSVASKLSLSCMSSRGSVSRSSFNSKTPMNSSDGTIPMLEFYTTLPDTDGTARANGPYKKFIHFTESSLDMTRISQCLLDIRKLRDLINKLSTVDITLLTYKQKLAFWINIYNACIMQAFLQHGVPPTQDKLLMLLKKAALNVGGIVLNALAIEHFILRHHSDYEHGDINEKEALLRHTYGLGYPEPNVTFALCRGSRSSPALRVYTGEDVVNELEKAKVEYLEASVGVTSKKIIVIPKLLHWHMRDFADDTKSLLEWIYSQLPRTGSLKGLIMECLRGDDKLEKKKLADIQPYEPEFRYLIPV